MSPHIPVAITSLKGSTMSENTASEAPEALADTTLHARPEEAGA
jgi:hypothetical protein